MDIVRFEYFEEDRVSKFVPNDSYPKGMLVAYLFAFDGVSNPVHKASHMCFSHLNYEGNFFYDDVQHPFVLDISSLYGFSFKMDTIFTFTIDPSVYSLIAPSSSGGTSSGTVDLTPIQNAIIALSSKIEGFGKFNLLDLNGQFGSYRNGTKVLISGHTEEYTVLSSSLIWDDKIGALVLTYDLKNSQEEFCPCSHPLLSLVPTPTPTTGA